MWFYYLDFLVMMLESEDVSRILWCGKRRGVVGEVVEEIGRVEVKVSLGYLGDV